MNGMAQVAAMATVVSTCMSPTRAFVVIDTVSVGNPGNAADTRYTTQGYGRVVYMYNIGKFEVTAGQYVEFLNAVAREDTHALYSTFMRSSDYGCNIERSGASANYVYSVAEDWAERPVNYVSWGDAARFANWLYNGQPTGAQDLGTTEGGSYFLNGAMTNEELAAVVREPGATWVIPSEDEWYKAAYHKNGGVTGNYFDYPTGSDAAPSNYVIDPDPGNNANFFDGAYTIGGPYWRTEFGEFENSQGPYGTYDQGGNVSEWNEAVLAATYRGFRGGDFYNNGSAMRALFRVNGYPSLGSGRLGFRVAQAPGFDRDSDGDVDLEDFEAISDDMNLRRFARFQVAFTGPNPD